MLHPHVSRISSPVAMIKHYLALEWAGWKVKLPLVALCVWIWEQLHLLQDALVDLLIFDPRLVTLAVLFVLLDIVTGLVRSVRNGQAIRTYYARRATAWKVFEHTLVIVIFTLMDNGFVDTPFNFASQYFSEGAFFWVCMTDGWSCLENVLLSKKRAGAVVQAILSFTRNPKKAAQLAQKDGEP